jgi:hypothetical protein
MQGCSMLDSVPGGDMISSALGLEIPFKISGAPTDEVLATLWYTDRINMMSVHIDNEARTFANEMTRLFDINVNAQTDAEIAALNETLKNIDAGIFTAEQTGWLKENGPRLYGLLFAGKEVFSTFSTLTVTVPDAFATAPNGAAEGRYTEETLEEALRTGEESWESIKRVAPTLESFIEVGPALIRLVDAAGVTPPTPEEERAEGQKIMAEALPAGDELEFS